MESTELKQNIVNAIETLEEVEGISLEVCGSWLWVDGDTKPVKDLIKSVGGKWAAKKKKWYVRPEGAKWFHRKEQDMERIREGYGSIMIKEV